VADWTEAKKQARYWLSQLGIDPDELAKQYPDLAAAPRGRSKHPPVPQQFLAALELFARVAVRDRDGKYQYWYGVGKPKLTRKKAIQWMAEAGYLYDPNYLSDSADHEYGFTTVEARKPVAFLMASRDGTAFASYLEKELRRNGFHKKPEKELLVLLGCPGLDVKQLCLDIVHIPPLDD
jgi:hypothetical protein